MKNFIMKTNFVLIDIESDWKNLLPLTYFIEISNIPVGIIKIKLKWERYLRLSSCTSAVYYLKNNERSCVSNLFIRSSLLPDSTLVSSIKQLKGNECLTDKEGNWLACKTAGLISAEVFRRQLALHAFEEQIYPHSPVRLTRSWDLILQNENEIRKDFELLRLPHSKIAGKRIEIEGDFPVYISPESSVDSVFIDASEGPVYIEKSVKIMPYSYIKGPVAIMEGSVIKAGTRIYNGTRVGPVCKMGGEVKNVLFFGFSNKAHDGYLGDSVIGEWCNLGAGTSNSNLKNNYSSIKMWHIAGKKFENTGQMFLGTVMGNYSKTAINSRLNTGTVIGVSSNIFIPDFPPKFVNSFNWGGKSGTFDYEFDKALQTAETVWARRGRIFDRHQKDLFKQVFEFARQMEL